MLTAERLLASRIINNHGVNRIFIGDLEPCEHELFDKVLIQSDERTQGDWGCEGVINLYCNQGGVQIYGSNLI